MPIEVRELVIRARVEDPPQHASGTPGGSSGAPRAGLSEGELQRIIALCAEEVMRILEKQKER
ncbi:DUF5908 family protein [Chitinophaga cymbidii]|uniref:Uncharacterized protein n=1 Tax=Chitinophaga cymbidii TaxID=1096750 RepID=A0A512RK24_9BACT|nr:DUF5908 family protein [Chitinophaga cymbidii]GEP96025.1 hypothetical protein CCY01nite_22850 [Chitinophaga cymbidii]